MSPACTGNGASFTPSLFLLPPGLFLSLCFLLPQQHQCLPPPKSKLESE